MSDFDKEAEREKLREKYERDQAERQATQRMSDLLLKGATMTNSHCGTCGDPLFQQDGTTFCPSCHGNPDAVSGTDLEAQPAADERDEGASTDDVNESQPAESADTQPTQSADARRPADDGAQAPDPRSRQTGATTDAEDAVRGESRAGEQPSTTSQIPDAAASSNPQRDDRSPERSTDRRQRQPTAGDTDTGDARQSLEQALEHFAAEAAAADDPRYAKACLEAAREASETLNTLR
ncbi:hypothetical protein D8Y22_05885 [Salinadaptatus halalkaliphilus]|uniref:Sjogrens syndrome scleroderma autoantigen 1 n=1 Tax=Salinadaptatus halalkaliphilus TaxID=2419781 RepID=A0A4S3TPT6_9EURY|nr:Sjogren's syndrome/scleroderma autoantigen 1 family protein [Salinadaptatus halalkaliphilus]THE65700.1 hypothetical protein D8Y22_05885 [Salinadaptatus halalkaliphilus]